MSHRRIVVALVALVACSKAKEPEGTSSQPTTSTPTAAKPVAPPAPACVATAFKNEAAKDHPTFCLSVPEGLVLPSSGANQPNPDTWLYGFGPGDGNPDRTTLMVYASRVAKPAIASAMGLVGPGGTHGPTDVTTILEMDVPNGKRLVMRSKDYDTKDDGREEELVVLSKSEPAADGKEWVVYCYSSKAKRAPAIDNLPCQSLRLL